MEFDSEALAAGDENEFNKFCKTYYKFCLNKCHGILKDKQKANDVTQEVFCNVIIAIKKGTHISNYKSFISKIAYNECMNTFRKKKPIDDLDDKTFKISDTSVDVIRKIHSTDIKTAFEECLEKLPEKIKKIVRMRLIIGMTFEVIAEELMVKDQHVRYKFAIGNRNMALCLKSKLK